MGTLHRIYWRIYIQPLEHVIAEMIISLLAVTILMLLLYPYRKIIGRTALLLSTAVVTYSTVLRRKVTQSVIILQPFNCLRPENFMHETIRMLLMNALMFLPFGMFAPFAFEKTGKRSLLRALVAGVFFAVFIEVLQYVLKRGTFETDDIIMNSLGCWLGTVVFSVTGIIRKRIHVRPPGEKKKKKI